MSEDNKEVCQLDYGCCFTPVTFCGQAVVNKVAKVPYMYLR